MGFHARINRAVTGAAVAAALLMTTAAAQAQEKVRVALGDVVSVETLAFVIALERAKERGVDYELTSFAEEELAIQAVVSGQADIGVGTPYSIIQKTKVPLRALFQMSHAGVLPGRLDTNTRPGRISTASPSPSMPAAPAPRPSATSSPSARASSSASAPTCRAPRTASSR